MHFTLVIIILSFHNKSKINNELKLSIQVNYNEELLVDYRWYSAHNVTPAFPFGHGLSYTSFSYNDFSCGIIDLDVKCSLNIANIGETNGAEVAQLYVVFPDSSGEPFPQLKGFHKTAVLPPSNGKEYVDFVIPKRDLSIWDINKHSWSFIQGTYAFYVGSSSQDIRWKLNLLIDF